MQEKEQKISPIKQRILYFAAKLGISKRDFYTKIGVSRGTLESKTGITEDVMAKFIATYPNVSATWLLTGEEPMLKPDTNAADGQQDATSTQETSAYFKQLLDKIEEQAKTIGKLELQIEQLERRRGDNAGDAQSSGIANVG